jgi:hypothetical protein
LDGDFSSDRQGRICAPAKEHSNGAGRKGAPSGGIGPNLSRPHVDTLKASKHLNIKELRLDADDGVGRVAFAFYPDRRAIILLGGDKSGASEKRFYKNLIAGAEIRFDRHPAKLKAKNMNTTLDEIIAGLPWARGLKSKRRRKFSSKKR